MGQGKFSHYVIIVLISLLESITHFGTITSADSLQYFNVTRFLLGISVEDWDSKMWITRPLIPAFAAPLSLVLGLPTAFGIVNSILIILASIVHYHLTIKLTGSERVALISTLMLGTSFITISYGASSGKEGGGIFFQILSMFLILRYLNGVKRAAMIGLVSGVGSLAYETVYAASGFGFLLLIMRKRFSESIIYLTASLAPQLIPPLLGGYNIFERYIVASIAYAKEIGMYNIPGWFDPVKRAIQLIVAISPLSIICLLIGFLLETDNEKIKSFYLMFVTSTLAWFSWPPNTVRTAIVFYHSVYWLAGVGLEQLAKNLARKPILCHLNEKLWTSILLFTNAVLNNWLAYRWYLNPESYTITWGPIPGISIPNSDMVALKP